MARFYRADVGLNQAVSTEITGYTASALTFLADVTNDPGCLRGARQAAGFLQHKAWNASLGIFPFECESGPDGQLSYFFDSGIIIRGLLAVWRRTQETELLALATEAGRGMARDFAAGGDWHPVLTLPSRQPIPRLARWSRAPGCYQLKSALAWRELAEATGDQSLADHYYDWLKKSLTSHREYLPGASEPCAVMDRLHAYCYFLEGMSPLVARPECREEYVWGLDRAGQLLREIRPEFLRADVCAQLLRARLLVAGHISVDVKAAEEEAQDLSGFQARSTDPRLNGGFWFGRRHGALVPHVSPVPTAFAVQALHLWSEFQDGKTTPCQHPVI